MTMKTEIYSTILNVVLHMLILWTFLTIFFYFYVSKIEVEDLNDELGSYIDEYVPLTLQTLPEVQQIELKGALRQLPLDGLIDYFKNPSESVTTNNKWLLVVSFMVVGGLFLLFLTISLILKTDCNPNVDIKGIITENALTFLFVGAIEFVFFKFVAVKYVPVLPSVITNTLVERLKQNLG